MEKTSIDGWEDHIQSGCRYLKTARNGRRRPEVFNNELVFQLAAMAMEKLMVGIGQFHNQMPEDHTLSGLVRGLDSICPLDPDLAGQIQAIERLDDMCPLTAARHQAPEPAVVETILAAADRLANFANTQTHRQDRTED